MRMPRSIRVGSRRYTVTRDTASVERYIKEHEAPPGRPCELHGRRFAPKVIGLHMRFRRVIYVAPRLDRGVAAETLWHEVLHAAWFAAGLDATGRLGGYEEQVVSALTQPLLDALRRNPALVRYLTEDS